ncbi:MAG: GntR family transcriptional regulator [Gemmatimonadota bacterium]|nr:GntR family transcriptional regulator [Gemmatimonadota bacterium]
MKVAITAGELRPGEGLPSVRSLATELRVNPATVVQAYRQLETDGCVEMRQGSGTFVSDVAPERRARDRAAEARRLIRTFLADASRLGFTPRELVALLNDELNGKHGSR